MSTDRLNKRIVQVGLRLKGPLHRDLAKQARLNGRSLNDELVRRLTWTLQAEQLRCVVGEAVEEAFQRHQQTGEQK